MSLKFHENEKQLQPHKSYVITHTTPGSRHFRIAPLDQPKQYLYWASADYSAGTDHPPFVTVHISSEKGPIVAAAGVRKSASNSITKAEFKLFIGDPSSNLWTLDDGFAVAEIQSAEMIAVTYAFPARDGGLIYAWRRVRHREIVISSTNGTSNSRSEATSAKDWKLISLPLSPEKAGGSDYTTLDFWEGADDRESIMGAYVNDTSSMPFKKAQPHLHLFENLGDDLEARALAVIMALSERQKSGQQIVGVGTGVLANTIML